MPGPHVDKAFNDNVGSLTTDTNTNTVGGDVFRKIEADTTLTHAEKQEVHQRLGKAAMQHELTKANGHPPQLLRSASPSTNYITAYLGEYAKEYNQAVLDAAKKELDGIKIPNDPGLKERFPVMGKPQDEFSKEKPETLQVLTDTTKDVANRIVQAHDDNLHKLSPEAQDFLKSTMEPIVAQNDPELTNRAMSSTMMLKNTVPMLGTFASKLGASQHNVTGISEDVMKANVLLQAQKATMTYANYSHSDPGAKLGGDKAQDIMAEKMLTSENLDRTNKAFNAVAKGGQDLTDLKSELVQKEQTAKTLAEQTAKTLAAKQEMDKKLAPFDSQIKALEQKRDQLKNNPTTGDKIKAFFKHGLKGVDGEVAKLETKIEATKTAKNDVESGVSVEQRREELGRMKQNQAGLSQAMQMEKSVVISSQLENSGIGIGPTVSKEQVDDAFKKHELLEPAQKELAAKIKTQEKVLSVREKLGVKPETKVEGPKQGVKVH